MAVTSSSNRGQLASKTSIRDPLLGSGQLSLVSNDGKIVGLDLSMYPEVARPAIAEAIAFQQNSYELSSDSNLYEKDEHSYLKMNIRFSLVGTPDTAGMEDDCTVEKMDTDCGEESSEADKLKEEEKRKLNKEKLDTLVETVYEKIVEASRTKDSLYVGILFNVLCNIDKAGNHSPVPVFKVSRCMEKEGALKPRVKNCGEKSKKNEIGVKALHPCCTWYVDIEGRIYKNWTDYVNNNTLPKCLMVLPMGGFYQVNPSASNTEEKTYAWIEIGPSPAAGRILPFIDIASSVLGVGAMGVGIVALGTTVAAPVLIASSVCGAISGVYATARSTQTLVDRQAHQQSISPADKTARSAWLGVAGGMAGGLASGSSFLLGKAVKAGVTLGVASRTTFNAIAIGNIVVNGMGIGNGIYGIYQKYQDKEEVTTLEVVQVMAHILFFGNAVMNFKTAQTIINDTQQKVLQEYENGLRSNRHRKAFRQIRRNTQASNGDTTLGDSEIIRGIRSIGNKDDFFAGVVRSRKIFNKSNAKVTFKDGFARINNDVKFDPMEFSQQPMDVKINTVNAANAFTPGSVKSSLSNSTEIPSADFNKAVVKIVAGLRIAFDLAQHPLTQEGVELTRRLAFELWNYGSENREKLIVNLSKIALELVRRTRGLVDRTIEEIMLYVWLFARPKVDRILKDWDIDASNMIHSPVLVELVFSITQKVVNEIFDGLEGFLEEIIDSFSNRPSLATCTACSGYMLSDQ